MLVHCTRLQFNGLSVGLLFLLLSTSAFADDIIGKQISFRTGSMTTTIRVLNDGHLLITGATDDCKSPSGEIGGEAFIGRAFRNDFTCSRPGQVNNYTLSATASFNGNVLRITQDWTQKVEGKAYRSRQTYVLNINGGACSGTFMGEKVADCTVR